MRNTIILMTALVPTSGHTDLITFSDSIPNNKTFVLINGRSFEPVALDERVESLREFFKHNSNVTVKGSLRDDAPQNPEDMVEGFWDWWKCEIDSNFPEVGGKWDYVVASESYGKQVADSLGADFLPYDLDREFNDCRGTDVRSDIFNNWHKIIPQFRQKWMKKVVLFGQESVGKTTISRKLAEKMNVSWTAEFARPYLETVGEELSAKKMESIYFGQSAYQKTTELKAEYPIAVFDTDLMSTVGYYRIMGLDIPEECLKLSKMNTTVYYILPDSIPFIADPLRYGGDERESSTSFWIKLLEEFKKEYVIVPDGSVDEKTDFIHHHILKSFQKSFENVRNFRRD